MPGDIYILNGEYYFARRQGRAHTPQKDDINYFNLRLKKDESTRVADRRTTEDRRSGDRSGARSGPLTRRALWGSDNRKYTFNYPD